MTDHARTLRLLLDGILSGDCTMSTGWVRDEVIPALRASGHAGLAELWEFMFEGINEDAFNPGIGLLKRTENALGGNP